MEFKDVLSELLERKKVTPYRIGVDTKVSKQSVMNYLSGKNVPTGPALKELADYLEVSVDYLMEGKVNEIPHSEKEQAANFKLVPICSHDVVGGINNEECDSHGYITGYMPFVNAKNEDICVPVTNNSMYPTYPAGCLVQIRKLEYWKEFIEFGQVHIIELLDDRRLIKEVRSASNKDKFRLHSHNDNYDDTEVPVDFIRSVWLVLAKYEKVVM